MSAGTSKSDDAFEALVRERAEAAAREAFGCDADLEPLRAPWSAAGISFLIHFAQGAGWTAGAAFIVFVVVQAIKWALPS